MGKVGPRITVKTWLTHEKLKQIEEWSKLGLSNQQIAHNMGIHQATLCDWKNKHAELDNAIKTGKAVADLEVENAMYKSALGYSYDEVYYKKDKKTGEQVEVRRVTKFMPPSNTAQIFWLKNRKPAEWRDKQQVELDQTKPFEVSIKVLDE